MPKTFICVKKHDGIFIPFNQSSLKDQFEKTQHKAFDGACVGVVVALLELFISSIKVNYQFFAPPAKQPLLLSPSRCIDLQREYEQNIDSFFTIFIRDKLRISTTGFAEKEGFGPNPLEILNKLSSHNQQKNELILMKATFNLKSNETTHSLEHQLCLLKLNTQYIFCEPNHGVVIFNNLDNIKEWLTDEITNGALEYYIKPVTTKIVIHDHHINAQGTKEGLLTVKSIFFESFPFPAQRNLYVDDALHYKARL